MFSCQAGATQTRQHQHQNTQQPHVDYFYAANYLTPAAVHDSAAMEKYLRDWRQDAMNRHQYDTAIFVADKLLALTSRPLRSTACYGDALIT
jgi:hypothetical protein